MNAKSNENFRLIQIMDSSWGILYTAKSLDDAKKNLKNYKDGTIVITDNDLKSFVYTSY